MGALTQAVPVVESTKRSANDAAAGAAGPPSRLAGCVSIRPVPLVVPCSLHHGHGHGIARQAQAVSDVKVRGTCMRETLLLPDDAEARRLRRGSLQLDQEAEHPRYSSSSLSAGIDSTTDKRPRSLHGSTHPALSGLFVVSCLLNGGLFLWSNLSIGAEVWTTLCFTQACPTPTREKVFEFTLRSSVEAMWEAETYYVAILIVAGSAVWPYIKMVAMLAAWFWRVENGSPGERRRGVVARVLDLAGKFSLIDGFVMILLSVGFGFQIGPIAPPLLMLTVDVSHMRAVQLL